jgi:hypothetical protein
VTKAKRSTNGSRGPTDEQAPAVELPRDETDDHGAAPPPADYTVAVSPRQLAAGFAIVAALIVLIVRHRKKG